MEENEEPQKWVVAEEDDYIHVLPNWDIHPHANVLEPVMGSFAIAGPDCLCKPKVEEKDDARPIITHNSFLFQEKINESIKKNIK